MYHKAVAVLIMAHRAPVNVTKKPAGHDSPSRTVVGGILSSIEPSVHLSYSPTILTTDYNSYDLWSKCHEPFSKGPGSGLVTPGPRSTLGHQGAESQQLLHLAQLDPLPVQLDPLADFILRLKVCM